MPLFIALNEPYDAAPRAQAEARVASPAHEEPQVRRDCPTDPRLAEVLILRPARRVGER